MSTNLLYSPSLLYFRPLADATPFHEANRQISPSSYSSTTASFCSILSSLSPTPPSPPIGTCTVSLYRFPVPFPSDVFVCVMCVTDGLLRTQKDEFSIKGWDILLHAVFPGHPFGADPAPPVPPRA